MKEKLFSSLGLFGVILFYVLILSCIVAPLWYLGLPWWVDLIAFVIIFFLRSFISLLYVPLYIWSAFHVFSYPFTFGTIIWIIGAVFALFEAIQFFLNLSNK